MKLPLEKQIPIVFTIAVFLLAVVVFFAFRSMSSLTEALEWKTKKQDVLSQLDETLISLLNAETGTRGFIITGDEKVLEPYWLAKQRMDQNISELKTLVSDNPAQMQRLEELEATVRQRMDFLARRIEQRKNSRLEDITNNLKDSPGPEMSKRIRLLIGQMKTEETKLLVERESEFNQKLIYTYRMFYLAGFAGIFSLALANFAIFREAKKRGKAEEDLRSVNRDLEARVEERTREIQQKNDELKEYMRQREHSENRHRIALEAGNLGTWLFAPHTGKTEMDERSLALFGLAPEEFDGRGRKLFSRIHREDVRGVRKAFREALKKNSNIDVSFRYVFPDGSVRWLQCTGQPQSNSDHSTRHFIGHCRDITESKTAENIIRSSELFTRSVLDSLPAHIAVINREGVIITVNRAWEKFAQENCDAEKLHFTGIGQNYFAVCERAGAFDNDVRSIVEKLRDVLAGRAEEFAVEYPCHAPHEKRWFLLQASALKGGDGGAVISHINITDRKLAEIEMKNSEQFSRSIFENSPDCVKILELDGTLHSMNSNGLCIMEIDDFSEYVGKQWVDFWQGDENEMAYQAVEAARGGASARFEGFCRTAKGTPKWWDVSVAPIFDAYGKPTKLISTSRDITERRRGDEERERLLKNEQAARREAEIANRLRDEFLATVSHELRAPLNSILGWARMMEKGTLDEKALEKAVKTIVRNAESQNRLIEDLLDVSRIISGKMRLEIVSVDPVTFVEAALETVRPAAEAKNIKLELIETDTVSHIFGDPNRLQQVIWNLLSNAIKFTPGGGTVTVEIVRVDGMVEIRVRDTGVGIKSEFLPHVFERFRQADASSIRKFGGLGLGLAIVRHITEMHGGSVRVESEGEGCGSTFTVSLPVMASADDDENASENGHNAVSQVFYENEPKISLDGLLILVVDDEDDTRQLLVQSLTAFTRAQDRMRAFASGFNNHVGKPVEPDELATIIASLKGKL